MAPLIPDKESRTHLLRVIQHINFYNWCYRGSTCSIYVLHLRDASRTEDIVSLIRMAVTPPRGSVRTCGIWFQNSLYNWQHAICSGKHIEQSRIWYVRAWLDRNNMTRHKFSQHEYKKKYDTKNNCLPSWWGEPNALLWSYSQWGKIDLSSNQFTGIGLELFSMSAHSGILALPVRCQQ